MKRLVLLFCTVAAVAVPMAGSAQAARPDSSMATPNIVGLAASDPQLSTLVSLIKKAGLVKALSGSTKLTVFAPTNAAFAAVATRQRVAFDYSAGGDRRHADRGARAAQRPTGQWRSMY